MISHQTASRAPNIVNGVDVTALSQTLDAIRHESKLGAFQFRANNTWLGGGLNRSTFGGFFGAGREQARAKSFSFSADEPPVLLGGDKGANPVEFVLHALAACLTTTTRRRGASTSGPSALKSRATSTCAGLWAYPRRCAKATATFASRCAWRAKLLRSSLRASQSSRLFTISSRIRFPSKSGSRRTDGGR